MTNSRNKGQYRTLFPNTGNTGRVGGLLISTRIYKKFLF